ncbi:hypothetical protein SLS56_003146 [Neofusicoccum ribis]|uniref:Uncharacterized protein n=1 Tax=Neofusicoccum ribis TaxID=45134 RepID=A0ABR3T0K9_9PEZI
MTDDMGLGKSLSMISLIASDRDPATLERMPLQTSVSQTTDSIRCTLLVVPSSLVQTWETQLGRHLRSDSLKWFKHHGKQKVRHRDDVEDVDIVITTYETLSSEWGKRTTWISPVFSIYWHRLVLDEAHYIKDRTRQTAQAIFTLHADRRWAMTGTPVQNRLSDLASLFQFLRVHPYDNPERFNEDITRLWVNHAEAEAINRAKRLFHFTGIRRSNDTIELPKRTDKLYRLEFSSAERQLYESLRVDTIETLEGCTSSKTPPRTRFLNVLHRFNTLRMICNLGTNQSFTSKDLGEWNSKSASEAFAALAVYGQPLICKKYAEVEHTSPDPTQSNLQCRQSTVSTKIRSLVTDIEQNLTEKSVVFSFWTSTLDLVETALVASHIRVARVDGRVSEKKRKHELDSFRSNSSISVILLTISCGAVGLDLTAASRAYIMEPHWNPTVEEQALARIHRLGQKREVTTIRFVMNGTCEDHVRKVQDRKTLMADVLLSTKKASGTNKGPGRLDILRSLLN